MRNKDDLITLAPMENYNTPDLPTLTEGTSGLLKKVPSRWKNKAMIVASVSLLGITTLTGCGPTVYCSDLHYGGSGGAPIYVAYMTEQEALNIVHAQFENAGINLIEVSPSNSIDASDIHYELGNFGSVHTEGVLFPNYVEMQLIDEGSEIGIVLVKNWSWWLESPCTVDVRESIEQRFLSEYGISVHVIFVEGGTFGGIRSWEWDWEEISERVDAGGEMVDDETRYRLIELAEENLIEQTQGLIQQLRIDGIIE